ncbi:MAG: adenosylcobinamide-GDP ribazoletransferase [Proteobacteria bacterium]|nr:adenosylcobinamide-GDP ribazoletransferase [Pseudomonadota bacterium]MCP4918680.1 adenosylcobinamide-GDP ribazoletransferase [Pseudomonadota bacterium]
MRSLFTALILLTRVPVRVSGELTDTDLRESLTWFPLVGVLVGLLEGLVVWALLDHLPALVVGALAVAASVLVTGAFHEDALADVADGFGGGATKERVLEIMRDSRLGTYGVIALVLAVLVRVACLPELSLVPIVLAHALSRSMLPVLLTSGRAAREDGFVASLVGTVPAAAMVSVVVTLVATIVLLGLPGMVAVVSVFAVAGLVQARSARRIRGLTGDVLGAAQQLALLAVLLIATYAS